LLGALEVIHGANFLHRDIAPDNILVRRDGSPVLLDFGAARRAVAEMSGKVTGIVKPGYSPHEQYTSDIRLQGPWSDLFALGGTLYRAVTGISPEDAALRVDNDRMPPASRIANGKYRPSFLAGIDACLKVRYAERPQAVAQLRPMLLHIESRTGGLDRAARPPSPLLILGASALLVVIAGTYAGYEFSRWSASQGNSPTTDSNQIREEQLLKEVGKKLADDEQRREEAEKRRLADAEATKRRAEQEAQVKAATEAEAKRQQEARIAAAKRASEEGTRREAVQQTRQNALRLLKMGDDRVKDGFVSQARLLYERAADAGLAEAAMALAATFDPNELARLNLPDIPPDPNEARRWYERARELGAVAADAPLKRLGAK
jgi:hypothetical protein